MKVGDLVIWDSNFGYEIGILVGDGVMYNTTCVYMLTGRECRDASVTCDEVLPFTRHNYYVVAKKYHNELMLPFSNEYKRNIRKKQSDIRMMHTIDKYNL